MLRLLILALSCLLLTAAMREWDDAATTQDAAFLPCEQAPMQEETLVPPAPPAQDEPIPLPELPSAEEVNTLSHQERLARTRAIKMLLLRQTLRLVQEEHRLTPENLQDSALAARNTDAPVFWQQAMLALAGNTLSSRERHELESRLDAFYSLYRVDALGIRLFVETSGLSHREMNELMAWMQPDGIFNLPPARKATAEDLTAQAATLKDVFSAIKAQFESVHNNDDANSAAEALLPFLNAFDSTQPLRLASPQEQATAFSENREFFPPTYEAIREQRARLHAANYYGSPRLRAINYFLQ